MKKTIITFYFLVFTVIQINAQQSEFPKLTGPYLGQKLPGMIPELFAPGIVSTLRNEHCPAVFSPENDEVFWSATDGQKFYLFRSYVDNGIWTPPSIPEFTKGLDATNPVFTLDGKKLFFVSQVVENNQWFITLWYVVKTPNGWSVRKKVEEITSFGNIGYQVSFARNGTLYFSAEKEGGFGGKDLYKSVFINGEYTKPENLGSVINSEFWEESVYVSPDESFILFRRNKRIENNVISDFYISHISNNQWTEPVLFTDNLGAKGDGMWIGMSPDQQYIFFVKKGIVNQFTTMGSDMFWVDAKIIDDIRKH